MVNETQEEYITVGLVMAKCASHKGWKMGREYRTKTTCDYGTD